MDMQKLGKATNPYYPDVSLFLVLLPFISALNYYLTYSTIQLNWFLVFTFVLDTIQGYVAWLGVRAFILYLDRKWPYERGILTRIAIQLSVTLLVGLLIISALTELSSRLVLGKPAATDFYTRDLVIISIWFFVINGIYLWLYYYHQWQTVESRRIDEQRVKSEGLVVTSGKKELRLTFDQLAGFYVEADYTMVCQDNGPTYCLEQSLDKVEKKLPPDLFFRLNRQCILHRQLIAGFRRGENGKLTVLLADNPFFPAELPVSRTKAPAFKDWFEPA